MLRVGILVICEARTACLVSHDSTCGRHCPGCCGITHTAVYLLVAYESRTHAGARLQSWLAATETSLRPRLLLIFHQLQWSLAAALWLDLVHLLQQLPMMQPSFRRCPRQIRARKAKPAKARKSTTRR